MRAMPVPLLELTTQNGALAEELNRAALGVLASGRYIMGPEIDSLEAELAEYVGVPEAISVSSGTDALVLVLMALGIGPGDEVIVPSFTFFATAGSVARLGATPVFADCCPRCFNVRREDLEPLVTSRTRAIMPVHLFGQCAPMDGLLALAAEHGLALIEDAAQAIGATDGGRQAGSMGTVGCFSFFPSKTLGGFGDGGLVTTNDAALAGKMRILRVHGGHPKYYHGMIGGNFRMDPLQAALLRVKLPRLEDYIEGRRANAARYQALLAGLPGVVAAERATGCTRDCACPGAAEADARLILPAESEGHRHTYNQFTLRLPGEGRRDALRAHLNAAGIGNEIYYPVPLHRQECFTKVPDVDRPLPHSERLATEVLSIPIYPELTEDQVEEVAEAIRGFLAAETSS
jgi:dTDP-4-amino-4,6-dideoxygalactose transaminase